MMYIPKPNQRERVSAGGLAGRPRKAMNISLTFMGIFGGKRSRRRRHSGTENIRLDPGAGKHLFDEKHPSRIRDQSVVAGLYLRNRRTAAPGAKRRRPRIAESKTA